jgi:hypothetical protein
MIFRKLDRLLVKYARHSSPFQWAKWWYSLPDGRVKDRLSSILFDETDSLRDLTDERVRRQVVRLVRKSPELRSAIIADISEAAARKSKPQDSDQQSESPDASSDKWQFVPAEAMTLYKYPCGLQAGDVLRLRHDVHLRDHRDQPTGQVWRAGEEDTVLAGNPREPNVIWLRRPDNEQHTWDDASVLETYEPTGKRDPPSGEPAGPE